MHSSGFTTPSLPAAAQLWAVLKDFHTGDFLRDLFKQHHLKLVSVGKRMGTSGQNISGMFNRAHISDDTLARLSKAAGFDILSAVRRAKASAYGDDAPLSVVAEQPARYGSASDLLVHLDEYDEATQLKILRFIQQLPKRR